MPSAAAQRRPCRCAAVNAARGAKRPGDCAVCWRWLNDERTWSIWGDPPAPPRPAEPAKKTNSHGDSLKNGAAPHRPPCTYLGRRVRDETGRVVTSECVPCGTAGVPKPLDVFGCQHPQYGPETTLLRCESCPGHEPRSAADAKPGAQQGIPLVHPGNGKTGGVCGTARQDMTPAEMSALIESAPPGPWPSGWAHWECTRLAMLELAKVSQATMPPPPSGLSGRGIVIAASAGPMQARPQFLPHGYMPSLWVLVNQLRRQGCELPIQVWHLGDAEMDPFLARLLGQFGVDCVDALAVAEHVPARILCGWELKLFALLWCPFEEVMFLDADNCPVKDPTQLFEDASYQQRRAMFWPDYGHWRLTKGQWHYFGTPHRDEPAFESGQLIIDKPSCWKELWEAWFWAEHSDYSFRHVYGDKEMFHLGWRRHQRDYAMPTKAPGWECNHTIIQHDDAGQRQFLHRVLDKWQLRGGNRMCASLERELENTELVGKLSEVWSGRLWHNPAPSAEEREVIASIEGRRFTYWRLPAGDTFKGDLRTIQMLPGGAIGEGSAAQEKRWEVNRVSRGGTPKMVLSICSDDRPTCQLIRDADGDWCGRWLAFERCGVVLSEERAKLPPAEAARRAAALLAGCGYVVAAERLEAVLAEQAAR